MKPTNQGLEIIPETSLTDFKGRVVSPHAGEM
jgi:hypothetical protein